MQYSQWSPGLSFSDIIVFYDSEDSNESDVIDDSSDDSSSDDSSSDENVNIKKPKNPIVFDKIHDSETNKTCAICLDLSDSNNYIITNCKHIFHNVCITEWCNRITKKTTKPNCPLCRTLFNFS